MSVFEITIQRRDEDAWPVVVRHQPSAQALARWSRGKLELDPGELESLLPSQKEYGLRLGQALFRDDIRDAFVGAMAGAAGEDELLRVLLIIEADDLRDLHWEQLCAPLDRGWETLLLNQRTPFSRYLPSQIERRFPPFGRRDLRALLLVAGPEELEDDRLGLDPFDVAATVDSLHQALGPIPCDVLARVEGASGPPRLDVLCEQIATKAEAEAYTLLHLVCHGAYREATGETLLYFPQDDGLRPVPASTLIEHLGRLRRLPHLTFLSTCESADPRAEAGLGGLGQRLVRELGMPAAVAMTGRISADTAGALASAFYARLRESGEVDCALSAALVGLQGRADVTVPALFSRLGGRTLWTDALDRPLTEAEIGYGLGQMGALLDGRAPVLKPEFGDLAATLRASLEVDPAALSAEARRERQAALAAANQLCSEALDLSFNALALGQPPPDYDGRCPFPGLLAFGARYVASGQKEQDDRAFFFGREALVDKLVGRLMEHPFLAVLGPSGCGKSSLVLAGMIPALQKEKPPPQMAYMTPGNEPLAQLEAALAAAGGGDGGPGLVVVDQFEELFTLCRHESKRQVFVDRLLALSADTAMVLTLRADFWGECAAYGVLKDEMQAHQELVAPMDAAALRRATECQADRVGLRFEAGLGEAILDDVEGEPGAMPLLQHALLLLWQRRHGRWLRWEEYRAIGGIQQAIAHTADDVYLGLAGQEQARMRDIFLRLTRLEEAPAGAEARDTRRRVGLAELVPAGREPADTEALVKRLADARLVVTSLNAASGQEEVEVAHEALIRHWPRLRGWLNEDRAELHLREGVGEAALEWEANEQEEAYLVHRGGRLEDVEALRRQPRFALNELEEAYVEACVGLRERERQERAERRRKELEAARKLAAEQQARAEEQAASAARIRKRAMVIGAMGIAALVLAVLATLFWLQANAASTRAVANEAEANNQRGIAEAQAANAEANLEMANVRGAEAVAAQQAAEAERNRADKQRDAALRAQATAEAETQARTAAEDKAIAAMQRAELQFRLAASRAWAARAIDNLEVDPELSVLLALQAISVTYAGDKIMTEASENALHQALWLSRVRLTLAGHREQLSDVAYSPDGTRLATSSGDRTIRVWDASSGKPLLLPIDGQSVVLDVVFSPDGARLATGGADKRARIWDAISGTPVLTLTGHTGAIWGVAYSPDGTWLATASGDKTVRLWDAISGTAVLTLTGHTDEVHGVAFSEDGTRLATASNDGTARVWNALSGEELFVLDGHRGIVSGVAFSPDGKYLATASAGDGTAKVWDMGSGHQALATLRGHQPSPVYRVAFSPDGEYLATSSADNTAKVWQTGSWQEMFTLLGHTDSVWGLAFSPDGTRLATASRDRTAKVWDVTPGSGGFFTPRSGGFFFSRHEGEVYDLAFSPDGLRVASASADRTARVWDLPSGTAALTLTGHTDEVLDVAFSGDGQHIATASKDGTAKLWDAASGDLVHTLHGHSNWVFAVAFSPDSQYLATTGWDGTVRKWDVSSGDMLFSATGHTAQVRDVVFSPDGKSLFTVSNDTTVRVWDAVSGTAVLTLTGHSRVVAHIAVSPDGRFLATASEDKTVKVWDTDTWKERFTLTGHTDIVRGVAFHPDGTRLATASFDGTTKVWNLGTGQELFTLYGHASGVQGVAFNPGGTRLATAGQDGTVRLYILDINELMELARTRVTRSLTTEECGKYLNLEECPSTP